ncbi:MAG: 50S ribosomal protein L20 [Endomicrobium sp.]|jgi:large subunit ribosomal protein L20|nr:50S ribosomal protein L20 [Endomicrobium sp.]
MRTKNSVYTRKRKKKVFKLTKGFYASKKNRWRIAVQQAEKSLSYSYVGRKDKKSKFRNMWIVRLNASTRSEGITYSNFIYLLRKANIEINRKILSEISINYTHVFKRIVQYVKSQ